MKSKISKTIGIVLSVATFITCASLVTNAAPFPLQEVGGGLGTNQTSSAGQVPISTGSSTYTPAFINCSGGCSIVTASGTIMIGAEGSITSTLLFSHANASGTWNFTLYDDGNYLEINTSGTISGTNPVPYNILLQNCPPVATTSPAVTSSSWECALSQAENFPDGSRSFVDWDTEYYPTGTNPNIASGWFDNRGGTSSVEFPFELSWNDGSVNHVGFEMNPATNTSASNFNTLDNNGTGYFTVGTATSTTGAFDVYQNGANTCAGIYDSGAGTIYGLTDSLPAPAGCTALGGYYHGLAIGGNSSGTGSPIFGVLNSSESSNGRGNTALTVYDTNEVDTYNNELDDGSGNGFYAGTLGVGTSSVHGAQLYVNGKITGIDLTLTDVTLEGGILKTDSSGNVTAMGLSKGTLISSNGVSTASTLSVGSNGSLLTASSGASLGIAWISPTWLVAANNLSDLTNTSTARTNLGLGTAATHNTADFLQPSNNLSEVTNTSTARTNLGIAYAPSSSVSFEFYSATTTKPFSFQSILTNTAKTIAKVDCWEFSAATTTVELYYQTSTATSSLATGNIIAASLACGISGTSTTSFTNALIPAGGYLFAIVSSTVGTPTLTTVNVSATKS